MNRALPSPRTSARLALACALWAVPAVALAASADAAPESVAVVALELALVLIAAKLGGDMAVRLGQPSVLGELVIGIVLGNLSLLGFRGLEPIDANPVIDALAGLGVLVLLFEVGLESTVAQMLGVGISSFLVALLGVAAPLALGWGVGIWLVPEGGSEVHAFLGATLCATSVGITARVLQDLGRSQSREARIILGAAVIDDVLGLVILAVVSGSISAAQRGGGLSAMAIAWIVVKAALFLALALAAGLRISPRLFRIASRLKSRGVLLAVGLSFCFLLSWISAAIGLAPIVGAFAAGLVLEEVHYRDFVGRGERTLAQEIRPISDFLVPIFFVLMGMRTDLRAFAEPGIVGLAAALTAAAIVGKQACSLGVVGRGVDRLSVGVGMIPRGEVGLIFASVGRTLEVAGRPVLDARTYSAVVMVVVVTTLVTPPALRFTLARKEKR